MGLVVHIIIQNALQFSHNHFSIAEGVVDLSTRAPSGSGHARLDYSGFRESCTRPLIGFNACAICAELESYRLYYVHQQNHSTDQLVEIESARVRI